MSEHPHIPRILVVDDHREIRDAVGRYLEKNGLRATTAKSAAEMDEHLRGGRFDLVILDVMMPGEDGLSAARRLSAAGGPPILMLSAREDEVDRVSGLTLGADDYVVKPFSPRELVARVKAILRRGRMERTQESAVLSSRDLVLDDEKRKVTVKGLQVMLTPHEFTLLKSLMSAPGKVFTRDELLARLYPRQDVLVVDRVVDVHIGKLRQKIEEDPSNPTYVLTVRGVGYQFAESAE